MKPGMKVFEPSLSEQPATPKAFENGKGLRDEQTLTVFAELVRGQLEMIGEEETGAEHCQDDNPTIGQEKMADWLADRLGVDQRLLGPLP